MGKILIVENTTSLLDRIDTRNINHRITSNGPLHSSHRSYSHSHPRGTSSGRRPPRERKSVVKLDLLKRQQKIWIKN